MCARTERTIADDKRINRNLVKKENQSCTLDPCKAVIYYKYSLEIIRTQARISRSSDRSQLTNLRSILPIRSIYPTAFLLLLTTLSNVASGEVVTQQRVLDNALELIGQPETMSQGFNGAGASVAVIEFSSVEFTCHQ